jgi:hypothetical protein
MRLWQSLLAGALACLAAGPAAAQEPRRDDWRRDDWRRDDWRRDRRVDTPEIRPVDPRDRRFDPRYDRRFDRRSDDRHMWSYSANGGGNFADQGNGRWVENTVNGQFVFRETARTPDYVELLDDSRAMRARIYDDQLLSFGPGQTQWQLTYTGGWR